MVRAIQGHSSEALKKAGGFFANAQAVFCADSVSPEVPEVAFHRTMKSHWKNIAKCGLIPGGGESVNPGRAHVYLSEKRFGLRGKCPIEIKVAIKQAVQAGVIFSKSSMDRLMTAEKVPSQFIAASVYETTSDTILWIWANSNLVNLVARDDRDLGNEEEATSSRQPNAPSTETGDSRKRGRNQTEQQGQQPPSRARRVFLEARQKEPFTGECPVCFVEYMPQVNKCAQHVGTTSSPWMRVEKCLRKSPIARTGCFENAHKQAC